MKMTHLNYFQLLIIIFIGLLMIVGTADIGSDDEENNPHQNSFVIPFKTIKIDGNYSDWSDSDKIYTDSDGPDCGDSPGQDIKAVYIAQDDSFIYLRFILNAGLDETFGYKFGEDLHIYVGKGNGDGNISYATPTMNFDIGYNLITRNLPSSFVAVTDNQFECKFYKYDVRRWDGKGLSAWCDQGFQTICRDDIELGKLGISYPQQSYADNAAQNCDDIDFLEDWDLMIDGDATNCGLGAYQDNVTININAVDGKYFVIEGEKTLTATIENYHLIYTNPDIYNSQYNVNITSKTTLYMTTCGVAMEGSIISEVYDPQSLSHICTVSGYISGYKNF